MRRLAVGVIALAATIATPLTLSSAGAAATTSPVVPLVQQLSFPYAEPTKGDTDIYAVHGLNLAGQTAQSDRGTPVTVCAGGDTLIADFQFGDIAPKITLPSGSTHQLKVFAGAGQSCTGTNPLIDQSVTVPDAAAVALVATSGPGTFTPVLQPFKLQVATPEPCLQIQPNARGPQAVASSSRLQAAHAAAAGQVDVLVNDASLAQLSFGQDESSTVPPATYKVQVNLGSTPIVPATNIPLAACQAKVVYVVGNQPLPESTTTTTSTTTSTAPPSVSAGNQTVTPAFTG